MFICETENMIKLSSHNRSCWNADHADCRLQTVQTVQTECYFFTCTFSKPCQVKWLKIKPFSASYNGYERDISSISLIVDDRLWFHSVIQTGDLPSFLQILQIPMSSLSSLSSLYIYLKINILIFTCLAVPKASELKEEGQRLETSHR